MPTELVWLLPALAALFDWYAVARDRRRLELDAKPAVLALLIVAALVLGAWESPEGRWLVVALGFGLLGDVALLSETESRFLAGVWAFLLGHLAFVACFVALGLSPRWWSVLGLLVLAAALGTTRQVPASVHGLGGARASVPVGVYMAVIAAMLVFAWLTGDLLVAAGASVFVASDSVLSVNRFVRPLPQARLAIMVTYHAGQALILLGVLA